MVNPVPADAYHFCLALSTAFTQPGAHILAEPCRGTDGKGSLRVPDPTQRRYKKRERRYDDTRNGADGKTMSEQIGWLTGQFSWDWVWQRPVSKSLTSIYWKHATKLNLGLCWPYFQHLLRSRPAIGQGPRSKLHKQRHNNTERVVLTTKC